MDKDIIENVDFLILKASEYEKLKLFIFFIIVMVPAVKCIASLTVS